MSSLTYAGYILALIGGILIVISGLLRVIGSPFLAISALAAIGTFGYGLVELIIGLICVAGSRYVGHLGWAIALIVLGVIAGGIGGGLVILGALLGLLSKL